MKGVLSPVMNTSRESIKNDKKNKFIFFCIKKYELATKPKKIRKSQQLALHQTYHQIFDNSYGMVNQINFFQI